MSKRGRKSGGVKPAPLRLYRHGSRIFSAISLDHAVRQLDGVDPAGLKIWNGGEYVRCNLELHQ